MNKHALYSAISRTERALVHLRKVWLEIDGTSPKTLSSPQIRAEVNLAASMLQAAAKSASDAPLGETPEPEPVK